MRWCAVWEQNTLFLEHFGGDVVMYKNPVRQFAVVVAAAASAPQLRRCGGAATAGQTNAYSAVVAKPQDSRPTQLPLSNIQSRATRLSYGLFHLIGLLLR